MIPAEVIEEAKKCFISGNRNRQNAKDCLEDTLHNFNHSQKDIKSLLASENGNTSITNIYNNKLE